MRHIGVLFQSLITKFYPKKPTKSRKHSRKQKKRNHLQVRASKVSSKNDWEKEKRAKVIIIWGQAEL